LDFREIITKVFYFPGGGSQSIGEDVVKDAEGEILLTLSGDEDSARNVRLILPD